MIYNLLLLNQELASGMIPATDSDKKLLSSSPKRQGNGESAQKTRLLPLPVKLSVEEMREQYRIALMTLCESGNIRPLATDDPIVRTGSYQTLQDNIQLDRMIPENDPFWLSLRDDIMSVSPMFFNRLQSLAAQRLKTKDIQTAMLIRCGISPAKMCVVFFRGKGSISQRRETLNRKLFDRKVDYRSMDMIIQSL